MDHQNIPKSSSVKFERLLRFIKWKVCLAPGNTRALKSLHHVKGGDSQRVRQYHPQLSSIGNCMSIYSSLVTFIPDFTSEHHGHENKPNKGVKIRPETVGSQITNRDSLKHHRGVSSCALSLNYFLKPRYEKNVDKAVPISHAKRLTPFCSSLTLFNSESSTFWLHKQVWPFYHHSILLNHVYYLQTHFKCYQNNVAMLPIQYKSVGCFYEADKLHLCAHVSTTRHLTFLKTQFKQKLESQEVK